MPAQVETGAYNIERGVPWHGLGTSVVGYQTAEDILRFADLDWTVELRPMLTRNGIDRMPSVDVPDWNAVVRMTDDAVLGCVGNRYRPAQNVEVLSFLDSIIGEGQAVYDSAWSLRGGKTVAISAELPQREAVAEGEDIRTFLTATTTHDGTGQIRFLVSPVRVVCMNTLAMATRQAQFIFARKHTTNALKNVEMAREALGMASAYQDWLDQTARVLIDQAFTSTQFDTFAHELFLNGVDFTDWAAGIDLDSRKVTRVNRLIEVWSDSENLENIRGTRWGALNAVAEFADYYTAFRGDRAVDNRTRSILMGGASELKSRALELLTV